MSKSALQSIPNDTDAPSRRRSLLHLFGEYDRARGERDEAEGRLLRFAETIRLVLSGLSQPEREEMTVQFEALRSGSQGRGGNVFDNVIWLFRRFPGKVWTVPDVKNTLDQEGRQSETKAIANVIAYLARTGRLLKVSRGRYVIGEFGVGLETSEDFFGAGGQRLTEHDI